MLAAIGDKLLISLAKMQISAPAISLRVGNDRRYRQSRFVRVRSMQSEFALVSGQWGYGRKPRQLHTFPR